MLLTKDTETLVLFPPGKANDKFTLLAPSIRKIGDYAFYQNDNLTNVVIPNRVTSLGVRSFGLCPNLNTVTLLCDNLIDPANIMQALNEATFDDGVTTDGYTQFDKIDLHLRKAVYDDYMANHYNSGDAVETFYQQFKSLNSSFNPLLRPGQSNDKNTLEEYIAVSSDVVSLIKATAIVGYIAVQDLTKMGDIVRSRTYEAFFPLIAITVIYFLLEGLLILLINRILIRTNPRRRKPETILKGVNRHDQN